MNKIAEVEVVYAHERDDFIYLVLRLIDGSIDAGNLLARPAEPAKWRITGFSTMPGKSFAEGLRTLIAVKWTDDAGLPKEKERLIAVNGPASI